MSWARLRLLLLLAAIPAVWWLSPESETKRPLMLIVLGLPLVFGLVPKNWLYGFRTPRTLSSSDEVWYIQNRITGVAMLAVGLGWLVIVLR